MKRAIALIVSCGVLLLPNAAAATNPGSDNASRCGAYHGEFAWPAHGALGPLVSALARSGFYKGGVVGNNASNPACHE